jgi:excisionase family DNA binding protein
MVRGMLYTVREAARRLGVAESTIRAQIRNGKIGARFLGGRWYIHAEEIERYREASLRKPETAA